MLYEVITVDSCDLVVGYKPYNYNTLEPKMIKANGLKVINKILV